MQMRKSSVRGFSLIEIMVGLVIGMMSIVIVMQVFKNAEGDKRLITGGNDAQMSGNIALTTLERDIRQAGYGFTSFTLLGCGFSYTTSASAAAVSLTALAPVTINSPLIPAGDANTDTLLVMYGTSNSESEGDAMLAASTTTQYQVTTPSSFQVNDNVIAQAAARPTTCNLVRGKVTAVSAPNLTVTSGVSGLPINSVVFNLGPSLVIRAYAVRNGNLTVCDYSAYNCGSTTYTTTLDSTVWVPMAGNVVSMRAQYGRDTTNIATSKMSGVVTAYDQITPGTTADTSGLPVFCSWNRALALRLALVARNAQYENPKNGFVTTTQPTWGGSATSASAPTNLTAVSIDVSGDTNWKQYRYRTIETAVPLRNFLWQGSQTQYQGGSAC